MKDISPHSLRPHAPALDAILQKPFKILDHGFIRVIDYMGDDAAIVQAARVSYGKGTKSKRDDDALIRYLLSHRHSSPFEMCSLKLHIKLPIFVARQWIRHRTASVNEYSARYSELTNEFYVPDSDAQQKMLTRKLDAAATLFDKPNAQATARQSQSNKQGRQDELSHDLMKEAINKIIHAQKNSYKSYERLLGKNVTGSFEGGVTRELARTVLPVGIYTEWYWTIDLHNLMHFLTLRCDKHAQYEIRIYADCIKNEILPRWVPAVARAFEEYRLHSAHLQKSAIEVIKKWLAGEKVSFEESNMTKREWHSLHQLLNINPEE